MTVVQPSFRTWTSQPPAFTMGSTARTILARAGHRVRRGRNWGPPGLMELGAHAMAYKAADHGVPVLPTYCWTAWRCRRPGLPGLAILIPQKALLGYVDEPSGLRADRAAGKGAAAIAVEAVQIGAHIHTDDIPLQQLPVVRDAVDHHLIDGDAGGPG